jgi:uncharacterized protein YndB with AHSA1/START domain
MATDDLSATTSPTPSPAPEIVVTRLFAAPVGLVFDVHTRCDHLKNWLVDQSAGLMSSCRIDLRPGGAYSYSWNLTSGTAMSISGVYQEVVPPQRLVSTEAWAGSPQTRNTLVLTAQGSQTSLTFTIQYSSTTDRDAAGRAGLSAQVSDCYTRLAGYLAGLISFTPIDPTKEPSEPIKEPSEPITKSALNASNDTPQDPPKY